MDYVPHHHFEETKVVVKDKTVHLEEQIWCWWKVVALT